MGKEFKTLCTIERRSKRDGGNFVHATMYQAVNDPNSTMNAVEAGKMAVNSFIDGYQEGLNRGYVRGLIVAGIGAALGMIMYAVEEIVHTKKEKKEEEDD